MQKEKKWNKKFRGISLFACSKQYIIISWCIWELLKYESWNMWTQPCSFSYCTRISMANSLKKTKVKLDLVTDTDILLTVEKGIEAEYVMLFIDMWKLITNTWQIMIKIKNHHKYWDVNNLYRWSISKMLPVNGFKWVSKDFTENNNEDSDEGY